MNEENDGKHIKAHSVSLLRSKCAKECLKCTLSRKKEVAEVQTEHTHTPLEVMSDNWGISWFSNLCERYICQQKIDDNLQYFIL